MSIRLPSFVGSVVEAALSPHPVDRYLELIDPMATWRDLRGRILRVEHPTPRTVRLTIRPTRQWQGHQAGQYIQLKTIIDGVKHSRCFSVANAAAGPEGTIELTITAGDDGFVSSHLREHARVDDVVGLEQASGEFTLPRTMNSAVFVTGGSGITPALSMLRTLIAEHFPGAITFVHYARTPEDVAYRVELSALAAVHENLDLRLYYTRDNAGSPAKGGHFTAEHLAGIPDIEDADVFTCGPLALMDAVAEHFDERVPSARVHREAFSLPVPTAIDPNDPPTGQVSFTSSGVTADNDGRPILLQAEDAGLSPESGCRMGICFSCTAVKKSGCTRNVLTGDTDTEADKQIQLCISAPVGDVEIDA